MTAAGRCVMCGEGSDTARAMLTNGRHPLPVMICDNCVLVAAGALQRKGINTGLPEQRRALAIAEARP